MISIKRINNPTTNNDAIKINTEKIKQVSILLKDIKGKIVKVLQLDIGDLFKKSITGVNKKTDEIILKIKGADWKTKVAIGGTLLVAPGGFAIASVLGGKLAHDYIKLKNEK